MYVYRYTYTYMYIHTYIHVQICRANPKGVAPRSLAVGPEEAGLADASPRELGFKMESCS